MTDRWLIILGLLIACVGAAVVVLALFRDRARGRRRCPKCWYDMSGTPALTCSECGHASRTERRFFRTRRRWRVATIGVLVFGVGVATGFVPRVIEHGWRSVVPTTAVILLGTPGTSEKERAWTLELAKRVEDDGLWRWQRGLVLDRIGLIATRSTWPIDEPLAVRVMAPHFLPGGWLSLRADLPGADERLASYAPLMWTPVGRMQPGSRSVRVHVKVMRFGLDPWYEGDFVLRVEPRSSRAECHRAVDTPLATAAVQALVEPSIQLDVAAATLVVDLNWGALASIPDVNVSFDAELLRDGEVVTNTFISLRSREIVGQSDHSCVARDLGPHAVALRDPNERARYRLRLKGVVNPVHWPTLTDLYWAGTLEYGMDDVLSPED